MTEANKTNPLQAIAAAAAKAPAKKTSKATKMAEAVVDKAMKTAKAKVAEKAAKPAAKKEVKLTKKQLALEIMKKNKKADRQTILGKFMTELGMSAAGANTYFYLVKPHTA